MLNSLNSHFSLLTLWHKKRCSVGMYCQLFVDGKLGTKNWLFGVCFMGVVWAQSWRVHTRGAIFRDTDPILMERRRDKTENANLKTTCLQLRLLETLFTECKMSVKCLLPNLVCPHTNSITTALHILSRFQGRDPVQSHWLRVLDRTTALRSLPRLQCCTSVFLYFLVHWPLFLQLPCCCRLDFNFNAHVPLWLLVPISHHARFIRATAKKRLSVYF